MSNSLINYLNKRLAEDPYLNKGRGGMAGPLITISREVGCNGLKLANLLALQLNEERTMPNWKVLSKEIFYDSAKELDMEPENIRKTFKKADRYIFEQILKAFSDKRYKSEEKIIKTVRDIVRTLSIDGFNIIVGRASHIIARDIKNALHIRLIAPMDYRINTIVHNNSLTRGEAIKFIEKVEAERIAFRKALNEHSLREELFDITLNRASFTNEQAVAVIEHAIIQKKILVPYKKKMEFY